MIRLLYCLLLLSYFHQSLGAFHVPTCWPSSTLCIQQNAAHAWCYVPKAGETALTDCKGGETDLQSVIDTHLNQDLSIAYYNGADNSRLGGASWPVPSNPGIIRLCASGKSGAGDVQTICMNIAADDSFSSNLYCEVALGPPIVSDGCYSAEASSSPPVQQTSTQQQSPTSTQTQAQTTTVVVTTPTTSTTSSPISSSNRASTSSTSAAASTSSGTTITIVEQHKTNKTTEIAVPIVVAVLGLIAAIWKLR